MPDTAKFTLQITNAEGAPAEEPDCYVGFMRPDGTTVVEAENTVFPPDRTFDVPAWPQEQNLYCLLKPSLYQVVQSGFFRPSDDTSQGVTFMRRSDQWSPTFQPMAALASPRFTPLKQVLAKSTNVDIKNGPLIGNLNDHFDTMQENGSQQMLSKMALLNTYAVLCDETEPINNTHWWPYVQQIVRIDQERIVAEADPALFDIVQTIRNNLSDFAAKGYFTEFSPVLHLANIPDQYELTDGLITIKCCYEQGNVHYTMGKATNAGRNVVLLDCEVEGHANLIEHTGDIFINMITGGTHPIDMHEYIVHHDHGVDLGYDLQPIPAGAAAAAGN